MLGIGVVLTDRAAEVPGVGGLGLGSGCDYGWWYIHRGRLHIGDGGRRCHINGLWWRWGAGLAGGGSYDGACQSQKQQWRNPVGIMVVALVATTVLGAVSVVAARAICQCAAGHGDGEQRDREGFGDGCHGDVALCHLAQRLATALR